MTSESKSRWRLLLCIAVLAAVAVWGLMPRLGELPSASKETPFENSLGMKFVPAGTQGVLFGIWDVRVKDYEAFVSETGRKHDQPSFDQGPDHPVVNVDWFEAKAFCQWLTEKDRKAGKIKSGVYYRLPEVKEWDVAVGDTKYPWGNVWPPPKGVGNYDEVYRVDEFKETSPVGSFTTNRYGLFDMGGNVFQWMEDVRREDLKLMSRLKTFVEERDFKVFQRFEWRVVRGAPWIIFDHKILLSYYRGDTSPEICSEFSGFRCVLVGEPAPR